MAVPSKPPLKRIDPQAVSGVPPADDYLQEQLQARERRKAAAEKQARRAARPKATYDLPLKLIEAIQAIAREEDVAVSDIAAWALAEFATRYQGHDIDLREHKDVARSLRNRYKLRLPRKWEG
jgi:hypothetical protein